VGFEQRKDDILFARAGHVFDPEGLGKLDEFGGRFLFEFAEIHYRFWAARWTAVTLVGKGHGPQ